MTGTSALDQLPGRHDSAEPDRHAADGRTVLRADHARQPGPLQRLRADDRRRRGRPAGVAGRGRQQPVRRRSAAPRAAPASAAVAAINTDTCVPVTCPGGAPFDVTVTLKDVAGNPTRDDHPGRLLRLDAAVGAGHHARLRRARVQRPGEAHPGRDRAGRHARSGREHGRVRRRTSSPAPIAWAPRR